MRQGKHSVKLTIFAATGGIGRQLLEQAIAAGHDVTAVARNPQNLSPVPACAVAADLASADPAALQPAVAGADAVLSALGPRTKADAGVAARGTKVITQAMQAAGVRRIIVVSAAPIGTVPSPGSPAPAQARPGRRFHHQVPGRPHRQAGAAGALRRPGPVGRRPSRQRPGLDRHPAAAADRQAGHRQIPNGLRQNIRRGVFVSRADVAHYMLSVLDQPRDLPPDRRHRPPRRGNPMAEVS